MRTILWAPAVLLIGAAFACADPTSPREPPIWEGPVNLVAPTPGALFTQNDASLGCPAHEFRGYGFRLAFDWDDVPHADRYAVRLKRTGALYAAVDYSVVESEFASLWCNAFVIDPNLDGWVWSVAAIADRTDGAAPDTLWSEARLYGFAPCRHPGDIPCTAPAGS